MRASGGVGELKLTKVGMGLSGWEEREREREKERKRKRERWEERERQTERERERERWEERERERKSLQYTFVMMAWLV